MAGVSTAMAGTARVAVRMAAVSVAVIRFFVLVMLFPPFSVFVGILANNTISNKEKKVDRELQSKTEKSESKNEAFYIVTMRGLWGCGLFPDHIISHRQTWSIWRHCFQRVPKNRWNGAETAINYQNLSKKSMQTSLFSAMQNLIGHPLK